MCDIVAATTKAAPAASVPDAMLVSPITGETVPADKLSEHLRIGKLAVQYLYLLVQGVEGGAVVIVPHWTVGHPVK